MRTLHDQKVADSYNTAVACYWRGDLHATLSRIDKQLDALSIILRARTLRRLRQDEQALDLLQKAVRANWPPGLVAEASIVQAMALTRLNRLAEAKGLHERARRLAVTSPSVDLQLELLNCESLIHFAAQDLESTRKVALATLAAASNGAEPRKCFVPVETSKAFALDLLACAAAASGSNWKQAIYSEAAIDVLEKGKVFDACMHAYILETLSCLLREVDAYENVRFIADHAARIGEQDSLKGLRARIQHALEFKRLLTAPDQAAADRLAEIGKSSAEIPTRMIAILDGERFKRSGGHWSGVTLDRACKLSESVSWKDTGDYRSALLVLARELAPVSTARARRVMDTYGSIPTALSPTLLANFNSRRRSQEAFVWGLVYRAEGQKEQAVA